MPTQYEARRRRKGKLSLKSMASSGKRRHRDASVPAGFFRAIHQSDVRDKKLMLPPQYNVDWLSRSATLIVANGHRWEVELIRNKEGIWFGNKGWQRFAEFYSLDYIHTLIFKYKGLSTFTAYIFDTTSMEITYPVSNGDETDGQPPQPHATSSSAQIIDAANAADKLNKKKGKSPIDCNSNKAMMMHEEKLQGPNSDHASEKPSSSRADPVTGGDGFTSVHPVFKIKMNSSYTSRGQPDIPLSFTTEHISKDEEWVKLEVGDKVWRIGLNVEQNKHVKLSNGWRKFVGDNSLKPGDVCVFELVNGWRDVRMKVSILKMIFDLDSLDE